MPGKTGRRPNDPAGPKGVTTIQPGQRRRYGTILVYRKTLNKGNSGYTVSFVDGTMAWYKYPEDIVPAIRQNKPVVPNRKPDIYTHRGTDYHQPVFQIIRRP